MKGDYEQKSLDSGKYDGADPSKQSPNIEFEEFLMNSQVIKTLNNTNKSIKSISYSDVGALMPGRSLCVCLKKVRTWIWYI